MIIIYSIFFFTFTFTLYVNEVFFFEKARKFHIKTVMMFYGQETHIMKNCLMCNEDYSNTNQIL